MVVLGGVIARLRPGFVRGSYDGPGTLSGTTALTAGCRPTTWEARRVSPTTMPPRTRSRRQARGARQARSWAAGVSRRARAPTHQRRVARPGPGTLVATH